MTLGLRAGARAYAERRLAMTDYLRAYYDVIQRLTGEDPVPSGDAQAPAAMRQARPRPLIRRVKAGPRIAAATQRLAAGVR
jgi:hypothetical protein